jgi:hypothetical protein
MSDFITILEAYVGVDTGLFRHIKHRQKRKKRAHEVLLEELLMNYTKPPAPTTHKRPRRQFKKRPIADYHSSMFYKDFHNINCKNPQHRDGKEFRTNYRMPWSSANKLYRLFIENSWLVVRCRNGQPTCPLEIKLLGILYWLGEGCSWRTIHNLSGRVLSQETFRLWAYQFCEKVCTHLAPTYVKRPSTPDELRSVSAAYEERGFPGAIGSMDGVQLAWEACPYALRQTFTGKEKYPTVGYNCTVDRDMRFMHVTPMFAGRFNDKTKIRYDSFVIALRNGSYDHYKYTLLDLGGGEHVEVGPYLLCDNGYHKWLQLICPSKSTSIPHLAFFSKNLESTRKDVERVSTPNLNPTNHNPHVTDVHAHRFLVS